jgi:predicted transcriptional regulator of viral defense system
MPGEPVIKAVIGPKSRAHAWDAAIAALAEKQHGVVARRQLLALGLGSRAIRHRLECGRLHRVHPGVYAVGHRLLSKEGIWMSAVLAVGPDAGLSHRPAAALWGIRRNPSGPVDVSVPRRLRSPKDIRVHEANLASDETTVLHGIPVTTVPRTLFDLASVARPHETRLAMHEAEFLRLTDQLSLDDLIHRHRGERGTKTIRTILEEGRIGATVTKSELEDRFLAFLDARGFPRPEVNVLIEGIEVDCLWRDQGVIVELDGHASHATRTTFESDRARDRALAVAGLRVVRVTWRHLHQDAYSLEEDLRALLKLPGAAPNRAARGTGRRGRSSAGG